MNITTMQKRLFVILVTILVVLSGCGGGSNVSQDQYKHLQGNGFLNIHDSKLSIGRISANARELQVTIHIPVGANQHRICFNVPTTTNHQLVVHNSDGTNNILTKAGDCVVGAADVAATIVHDGLSVDVPVFVITDTQPIKLKSNVPYVPTTNIHVAGCINCNLGTFTYNGEDFSNGDFTGTDLSYSNIISANLNNTNLTDAEFQSSMLAGSTFIKATAVRTNFNSADLSESNFSGAVITDANFFDAQLGNATWINNQSCLADSVGECHQYPMVTIQKDDGYNSVLRLDAVCCIHSVQEFVTSVPIAGQANSAKCSAVNKLYTPPLLDGAPIASPQTITYQNTCTNGYMYILSHYLGFAPIYGFYGPFAPDTTVISLPRTQKCLISKPLTACYP